jgi:transcription factor SOX1/3/14/21 (SOX group B)
MDVSKFTLDRNAYINTASALYDQTKTVSAASAYGMVGVDFSLNFSTFYSFVFFLQASAYLDPSVLTKAYFDSKLYQDRANLTASNYAFDISKMYGNSQQQHQQLLSGLSQHNNNNNNSDNSNNHNSTRNLSLEEHDNSEMGDTKQQINTSLDNPVDASINYSNNNGGAAGNGEGSYQPHRPLTVIF